MAAAGGGRGRETIAALAMVVVAAALVVVVTTRGAGRRRPTVLTPHPYLVPYAEFNAGPGYNHEALNYQATKAGASQEWLQYSLHHDGSLQQARASSAARVLAPARGRSARTSAAVQVRDVQAKSASDLKKGIVDTSGNFQEDDGTLFGGGTFDQSHESPGTPLPYQKEQTGGGDFDEYCEDEQGHEVPCGDDEYCLDDQGREVPCDYYCVDENGSEVSCDDDEPEAEPEPEKMAGPSDFLTSIVKAVSSEAMPAEASAVLKKSVNSVNAAKQELKEAAKLKAEAAVDQRSAKGLESRVAELEHYQNEKQKFAEREEELSRKADEEYSAEEEQVKEMDAEDEEDKKAGVGGLDFMKGVKGDAALRHRLQRHLPLLRVVNKLAQRVGGLKGQGRHPRFHRGGKSIKQKSSQH